MSPLRQLSPLSQRIVGVIIVLLGIMTIWSTTYYNREQRRVTECQAEFNNRFIQQLNQRNKIATSDRESLAELIEKVLTLPDREARRQALEDYLKTKEENDEERRQHPLPELPEKSARC